MVNEQSSCHPNIRPINMTSTQAASTNARFSTYSGAPSLQPSLAPSYNTTASCRSNRNNQTRKTTMDKRSSTMYNSRDANAFASTSTLSSSNDPKTADIRSWSGALQRMQDERLDRQRFVMNENKSEDLAKLALGAKVERALSRRMVGQDATFTVNKKPLDAEKRSVEVR